MPLELVDVFLLGPLVLADVVLGLGLFTHGGASTPTLVGVVGTAAWAGVVYRLWSLVSPSGG